MRPPAGKPHPNFSPNAPRNRVGVKAVPIGWVGTGFDDQFDAQDYANNDVLCRIGVEVESPKRLSVSEFKDLKGSLLYGRMFKNRIVLKLTSSSLGAMAFLNEVDEWLDINCGAFHCRDERTLYFERSSEAVAFHLRFHGQKEECRVKPPGTPSW